VKRALAFGLAVVGVVGCSGLEANEAGIVGIEVRVPGPDSLEVGESIQLSAVPLDKNGDSVAVPITWECLDPTATIDATTGVLTGVSVGTARVQANEGPLGSSFITFAVVAPADTVAISGDSIFTASVLSETFPVFTALLSSNNPPGPLVGRAVVFAITSPDPLATAPSVALTTNHQLADTVLTAGDGTAITSLELLPGAAAPDSAVVTVSATRVRGAVVPGSGQRFILHFTP
jgi:hypothetical protein